jgi:redox-sensitive bicupin YhaK (pirin superfamily)
MVYAHWEMAPGGEIAFAPDYSERAAFIAAGEVEVEGRTWSAGQMLVIVAGRTAKFKAKQSATVMALGGEPIGERHVWWNFVSSSLDRIQTAKADWRAGRFALPLHDHDEVIPLPED